jgi:5-methylcytosine-specific restriction endonuclease McrA
VSERICTIPGCTKPTRSGKAELCAMHYHRQYRHGSVERQAHESGVTATQGRRYRYIAVPAGHPLATANGRAYEHRVVLFTKIGPGPHACHWCGAEIGWLPKGEPGSLQVDHLNAIGDDNRPENLVPSCFRCNTTRGSQARHEALKAAGWWSVNDTVASLRSGGRKPKVA